MYTIRYTNRCLSTRGQWTGPQ